MDMKICDLHWSAIRQNIIDLGLDTQDLPEDETPYDANVCADMLLRYNGNALTPKFRPTLVTSASIYALAVKAFGRPIESCPLCALNVEYVRHVRKECSEADCLYKDVTAKDTPWDTVSLNNIAAELAAYGREEGYLPQLQ